MQQFQVERTRFSNARLVDGTESPSLQAGDIRVRIERFAFTANNVTYAAAGDMIGYWQFFPAVGEPEGDHTWGVIPVWGFCEVTESTVSEVRVGERFFGYFPPATELIMTPVKITDQSLVDGAEHRASLPPTYNQYQRVGAEPGYDASLDNERMLLWPLYMTAFCLWDSLVFNDWYGAEQVIVLSASSKTSIGMAYALHDDENAPPVVGLTSAGNRALVESLGLYDRVMTYDELESIDADTSAVIVDMSGNTGVLGQLHKQLGDTMRKTVNVGITHWDAGGDNADVIAERSEFFFAPGHIQQRVAEWGARTFEEKSAGFVTETVARSRAWLKLTEYAGLQGLMQVYPSVAAGAVAPDEGVIITL